MGKKTISIYIDEHLADVVDAVRFIRTKEPEEPIGRSEFYEGILSEYFKRHEEELREATINQEIIEDRTALLAYEYAKSATDRNVEITWGLTFYFAEDAKKRGYEIDKKLFQKLLLSYKNN